MLFRSRAVSEQKAGKVEYRVDKAGIVHASIGKRSFDSTQLLENASALIDAGMDEDVAGSVVPVIGRGCQVCAETGFKGRFAVYEVMPIQDELKEFILNGASSLEIKREAIRLGMQTLRQSAFKKLQEGVTTLSEVLRVSTADN